MGRKPSCCLFTEMRIASAFSLKGAVPLDALRNVHSMLQSMHIYLKLLNPKLYFLRSSLQEDRRKTTDLFSAWRILDSPWIDASLVFQWWVNSTRGQRWRARWQDWWSVALTCHAIQLGTGSHIKDDCQKQSDFKAHMTFTYEFPSPSGAFIYIYSFWGLTMEHSKYMQVWKSVHAMHYIYFYVSWLFRESLHKVLSVLY